MPGPGAGTAGARVCVAGAGDEKQCQGKHGHLRGLRLGSCCSCCLMKSHNALYAGPCKFLNSSGCPVSHVAAGLKAVGASSSNSEAVALTKAPSTSLSGRSTLDTAPIAILTSQRAPYDEAHRSEGFQKKSKFCQNCCAYLIVVYQRDEFRRRWLS